MRFFMSLLAISLCLAGQTLAEDEYILKAHILVKFTSLIDWPADSDVSDLSKPFVIAVIGANPFDSHLDEICGKIMKIKNKKIKIRYISRVEEIAAAESNILFIAGSSEKNLDQIISYTRNKPILTISDTENFAEKGVLINFLIIKNKPNFEINLPAVHESRLVVNYHLLELAAKVIQR